MLATVEESSLPELVRGHRELYPLLADDLEPLAPAVFFAPQGDKWSPAEHVDHLVRSVRPMTAVLRWPRPVLRVLFGKTGGSRPTEELVDRYLGRLASGAGARGRYLPATAEAEASADGQRRLLRRCRRLGDEVGDALAGWREGDLDRYRLPHPLLGRLSVREMVAWALYHGRHHHRRILERLEPGGGEAAPAGPLAAGEPSAAAKRSA
ncbi:MAG TPA: DinB family protein [Thermoanaerobaculia bacterium]|nr:DinB family protein [Thermoanaerobaculia bacterium]